MQSSPYTITAEVLKLVASIAEAIGEIKATHLDRQSPTLRKQNQIKTIHSSLQIEGNTLTEAQITALIDRKPVIGPQKDILEVLNAIAVYDQIDALTANREADFIKAHKGLLQGLIMTNGTYRKRGVGIVKGSQIEHLAPPAERVPYLMKDLFAYLKQTQELPLIKSCVFHYEVEFIHPFDDGNGRMGRLWQTVILKEAYPVFAYLPFETLISQNQAAYYQALSDSDRQGSSTRFVEFMLGILHTSVRQLANTRQPLRTDRDRLTYFLQTAQAEFTRKDYMQVFKELSTATASRDLKKGIELGHFEKSGDKKTTTYRLKRT